MFICNLCNLDIIKKFFSVKNSFNFDIDSSDMNCYILFSVLFQSAANLADHPAAGSTATTAPPSTQSGSAQPHSTLPIGPAGSTGSRSSSGNRRSDHPNRNQCILMPLQVFDAVTSQNQSFAYLLEYMELWDTADNLVRNAGLTGMFTFYFL